MHLSWFAESQFSMPNPKEKMLEWLSIAHNDKLNTNPV